MMRFGSFLSLGVVGGALLLGLPLRSGDGRSAAESSLAFQPATPADYIGLDEQAEPLRGSFNADIGKVRILMLVAPT
jgi:hypothetical protein